MRESRLTYGNHRLLKVWQHSRYFHRLAEVRNEKPMPLDVGRGRQGHTPFQPSPQPHYRPSALRWAQSGRFGRSVFGGWLVGRSVRLHHPETLALPETLVLLRAVVVLSRLQKVMRKPEIPLQSAETRCFGELGAPLSFLVPLNSSLEISSLSAFSPFLGTRSLFRVRSN